MTALTLSQKRALAGAKGGRTTVKRYGKRYMRKLAKFGAHVLWSTHRRVPVLLNDFALVHRKTGTVVALMSGRSLDGLNLPTFLPENDDLPFPELRTGAQAHDVAAPRC